MFAGDTNVVSTAYDQRRMFCSIEGTVTLDVTSQCVLAFVRELSIRWIAWLTDSCLYIQNNSASLNGVWSTDMSHRLLGRLLTFAIVGSSFCVPSVSEAGPLLDWLFQRRAARREALSPVDSCGCGAAYCEQTVVNYVPQTAYRTVWQPVPVTTYKRTTRCNPATGLPITCVQPCTNYTYQARRVPYTSYRPVYSKVPVTVPTRNLSYMPAVGTSGCNSCSTGLAASQYSSVPNYGSPGYSVPSANDYSGYSRDVPGATPWRSIEPTPESRDYLDSERGYDDPADRRPSLGEEPIIQQNSYSRALQRIPSTSRQSISRYDRDSYYGGPTQADRYRDTQRNRRIDRDVQLRRNSDSLSDSLSDRSAQNRRYNFRSDDDSTTSRYARIDREPVQSGSDAEGNSILKQPSNDGRSRPDSNIRPIPNLAPRRSAPQPEIPPLLNSVRDREASVIRPIATRWASNKIYWNEVARVERDRQGENAVRQASAHEPVESRQKTVIRTNDNRWEPVQSNQRNRARRWSDAGWSSAK